MPIQKSGSKKKQGAAGVGMMLTYMIWSVMLEVTSGHTVNSLLFPVPKGAWPMPEVTIYLLVC